MRENFIHQIKEHLKMKTSKPNVINKKLVEKGSKKRHSRLGYR